MKLLHDLIPKKRAIEEIVKDAFIHIPSDQWTYIPASGLTFQYEEVFTITNTAMYQTPTGETVNTVITVPNTVIT